MESVYTSQGVVSASFSTYSIIRKLIFNFTADWIFQISVLSFFISCIFTVQMFARKGRDLYIVCQNSSINQKVAECLRSKIGDYKPPWWYNRHFGTLIPFGFNPNLTYEREIFTEKDACFAVDWFPRKPDSQLGRVKICVFYPGLGLGSQNKFAQQFVLFMSREGFYCAIVTSRGVDIPLKSSRFWHPGLYDDSKLVLKHIDEEIPGADIFLVGFSAGTNIVQKTILDENLGVKIRGIMCVCVVRDYIDARNTLEDTFQGRIYSRLMTSLWKEIIQKNSHIHGEIGIDIVEKLMKCTYLSEYDKIACSAVYGYLTEAEYAKAVSSMGTGGIKVPFLALQPRDDPLHQRDVRNHLMVEEYTINPNVIYVEPEYGNHFGFYEGGLFELFSNKTSYTYPAKVAIEFFNIILNEKKNETIIKNGNYIAKKRKKI
mmetsp:Transcript_15210/g.14617  ORF Transcript_15210/g.14617 Transcript_15210/m.14617 type:complete len:430 (-) Transcript_15210:701-1990(-)